MALALVWAVLALFYPSLVHSTRGGNSSKPSCPTSFDCSSLGAFEYPFYDSTTDPRCGLCKLDCSGEKPIIQLGEGFDSYEISRRYWSTGFGVYDQKFQDLLNKQSCNTFNTYSFPTSPALSFTISNNITLFKCQSTSMSITDDYFGYYNSYRNCGVFNLYYKNLYNSNYADSVPIPDDLPATCEVLQLPVDPQKPANFSDLFSLLAADFILAFHVSPQCLKCHNESGLCIAENGEELQCEYANGRKRTSLILFIGLPGAAFILISCSVFFIMRRRMRHISPHFGSKNNYKDLEDGSLNLGIHVFSYTELEEATNNFDPARELGDGGFGTVYHGKLQDGREVAVKQLYEHNYKRVEQFMNEVEILTRLRHPNLVLLYGCTSYRCRELLLVYEYVPNGTVADHLHGDRANPSSLTWPIRMNIAIETASALAYLHASDIIHRDVKTNNILLDDNFCVKVADFGISRLFPNDVTHISTAPQGTPGYVDPEYHQCYQLTDRSDVYSFGVVLIELISSMPAVDISRHRHEINLANLAINKIQRSAVSELIDPSLGFVANPEVERMTTSVAELAFRCLQYDRDMRPTMNEVLEVLKAIQDGPTKEVSDSIGKSDNVKAIASPETEDVILLKSSASPVSPSSVADQWYCSTSTTDNSSATEILSSWR